MWTDPQEVSQVQQGLRASFVIARVKFLAFFSFGVGIQDSNIVEIMAIHKACELCASCSTLQDKNMAIVSNSMVAISWVNDREGFASFIHVNLIYDIRVCLQRMSGIQVCFSPRSTNAFADNLAKSGSSTGEDKLVWDWS